MYKINRLCRYRNQPISVIIVVSLYNQNDKKKYSIIQYLYEHNNMYYKCIMISLLNHDLNTNKKLDKHITYFIILKLNLHNKLKKIFYFSLDFIFLDS